MKIKDIVAALLQHDQEGEACILDHKLNFLADDGEGSPMGIYKEFDIETIEQPGSPWIALSFSSHAIDDAVYDAMEERTCRVCGCTDNDCRQCIEKTGQPCHWVEADLCSACQPGASILLPGRDF